MPRTHDRNDFYKLTTKEVARKILEHHTLRWRTPLQFNDPFDTQTRLVATVNPVDYADRFIQRFDELAFAREIPTYYDPTSQLHQQAMVMRASTPAGRRPEALSFLREGVLQSAHSLTTTLPAFSDEITNHLLHGRVFCMTESINNVVMWSHYSENHEGVAFKLRVLDDIDHPFLIAKPVEYSDSYISLGDSTRMADHFSRADPIDIAALAWRTVYLKHSDWAYEKEWRCYWPLLNEPAGAGFIDQVQDSRLFEAMYLGCRMNENDKIEMVDLAARFLPDIKIFVANKSSASFDLHFERIR